MAIGDFLTGLNQNQTLNSVFSNPMVLQYLSGIGAGLSSGGFKGGIQAGANITQQNISTQNYMKILQRMLGGDMSDGGKLTIDKDGMKISVPQSGATLGEGMAGASPTPVGGGGSSAVPLGGGTKIESLTDFLSRGLFNPFANAQSINPADLAGLNPEMISQALQFKFNQQQMMNQSIQDIIDAAYKGKLMEYYDAQIAEGKRQQDIAAAREDRQLLELLTKDERTELQKNYEYAKEEGFEGTLVDFKNEGGSPNSYKEYELAKKEGYKGKFVDFIRMKGQASATNINLGPYERTMETERAQRQASVLAPDFHSRVISDLSKQGNDWYYPAEAKTAEEIPRIQNIKILTEMDKRIRQAYEGQGKITRQLDGWYLDGKLIVRNPYAGR